MDKIRRDGDDIYIQRANTMIVWIFRDLQDVCHDSFSCYQIQSSLNTLSNPDLCIDSQSEENQKESSTDQQRRSTPRLLTHRYLTPLYGLTLSPKPRLRRWSMFKLSTLIPEGSQPRTEKDTEAEFGMRLALSWALVLRAGRDVEDGSKKVGR